MPQTTVNRMTVIHVVGIGLDGETGLGDRTRQVVNTATLLVGGSRHLSYFATHTSDRLILGDLGQAIAQIRQHLAHTANPSVVVLTSGDPLFFGLGRLLLLEFPPEHLTFHPHLSSVQLAFNRVKVPWQDARIISVHGRSLDELIQALQQGASPLAIFTDSTNTPAAIARLLAALDLPIRYQIWVCENLEGTEERILSTTSETDHLAQLTQHSFAALNVMILKRIAATPSLPATLPLLGVPDQMFLSFPDRPGLMTKREVRTLALAELVLQPGQVIWDIGAGTGSVSIEIARLCPTATIYAIEKTAVGISLIQQNCQRFRVNTIHPIHGDAPTALRSLPAPDRIFIGGSGGNLSPILDTCQQQLRPQGRIVLALATLDHLTQALTWLQARPHPWQHHLLQVNLSRSVPLAALTRWAPLNPVTLLILEQILESA
ncbi:MAG: precorrin-6y C5,15-methyltransferase (decarboxylating) subunit CbiE [Leptolyngbyaceae cyanobacterium bins.349]|nr:precorrin-6y C5,15-methyltransferase (decarboxylating) subunit CbiE [Leptolyngbyaceae cyanobacterium bins.349]